MIRGRAGERFGGQLGLDRPDLPGVRGGVQAGPVDLGVGHVGDADPAPGGGADAPFAAPPRAVLPVGRGRPGATAGRPGRRGCAPAGPARAGWPGRPGRSAAMPAGVSQHQAGPGPSVPVAAYPACRQRATIAAQPRRLHVQGGGEQVVGRAVMLGAQDQAGDVTCPQAHRSRRRRGGQPARGPPAAAAPYDNVLPSPCPARKPFAVRIVAAPSPRQDAARPPDGYNLVYRGGCGG